MSELLHVEKHGHSQLWTLNRPEALNALNKGLLLALNEALDALAADRTVRCVVIAGAGERAFCAGADLKERKTMPAEDVPAFVTLIGGTMVRVAAARVPMIAAVDGFALGGGLELALACDLRVLGHRALLGLTETRLAIIPGAGGTQRLPRMVGLGRAKELIFTGRKVATAEALAIGLAEVDGRERGALEQALVIAQTISEGGPVAIAAAKQAISGGFDLPMAAALAHERRCYDRTLPTRDRLEALVAFAEKRSPRFKGE